MVNTNLEPESMADKITRKRQQSYFDKILGSSGAAAGHTWKK